MKIYTVKALIIAMLVANLSTATAQTLPPMPNLSAPQVTVVPPAPELKAKSYVIMDADSGKVLAEKNSDERLPPASTTKVMTMYLISNALAHQQLKSEDLVTVSEKAWRMDGSRMFIQVGDKVPVSQLIQGIVVASGNDASVAMAEHLAGTEDAFAALMNQQAQMLGMNNSHFMDSTGMPNAEHYMSAKDLALLAQAMIRHFPRDYAIYSDKSFTYNNITQPNRNRLLWRDPSVDGLKTGHTDEAGYCLVASALRNGMRLIAVVMGEPTENTRVEETQQLLNYGFRFFETKLFYHGQTPVIEEKLWYGKKNQVQLGAMDNIALTMPRGQLNDLKVNFHIQTPLKAPLKVGQKVGQLEIVQNKKSLMTIPLVALETVEKSGFFSRLFDSIKLWFTHLFGGKV